MRRKPLDAMDCSIAKALDVVGDPWTLLVVRDLLLGVSRFDDFHRRLGVPRATLADRLQRLGAGGLVARDDDGRYLPTDKGRGLWPVLIAMMQWGDRWVRDDEPPTTLVDDTSGSLVDPVLVDRATGRPLTQISVRVVGAVAEGVEPR